MTDSDATPDDVRLSVAEQDSVFRPAAVTGGALEDLAGVLQSAGYDPLVTPVGRASLQTRLTGAAMNPQAVGEGDLFVAVSGARFHGADFAAAAAEAGAAAVLTDAQGAVRVRENVGYRLPVI